ncbi:head-tail adaptor protein [Roseicitreum antarcticum]|uniref:Head-tail adaptor n=1 Tax=Roseicitreum antarcticum TaxID=564137 RepID=A0A1H2TZ96_9RHOB|nr:head-tail adaptor protein [Roseicitreum antarcticum]SDW48629.1 head-tail adaptor [Roseicitreum antarcticum]
MRAPDLTRALVLEEQVRMPDGAGGYAISWVGLGTLYADVRAGSGRERALAQGPVAVAAVRIFVRGAPTGSPQRPRPDQRLREGDRIWRLHAVTEGDPHGRHLICYATQETPQ